MTDQPAAEKPRRSTKAAPDPITSRLTAEEGAALRERTQELKKSTRRGKASTADGESDVLAKIAEMSPADRALADRLHTLVREHAPALVPRTWYGMPAYAQDGKILCHFQSAAKFTSRYATLGFSDTANLDDGDLWATSFALREMTPDTEATIVALLTKAAG